MYSKFSTSRVCYFHTNKTYSYCISTSFSGQAIQPSLDFVTSQDSKIRRTLIDFTVANKGPSSKGYGFSCGHVWMWELDCEESWAPKNWCFWTVVLEKALQSPLDCKEIQPVHPKGDQSWVFIGRTDAEAETPILWPPHAKSWLIGKDSDAGRDWGQEENGMTEDEMAGWHHWLNGREFEWTPGVGDGQGGLACCDSCGLKESDTTEWLNWTDALDTILGTGDMYTHTQSSCS